MKEERVTETDCESAPDTEVNAPLTPSTEHISVDVGSIREASREVSTVPPPETRGSRKDALNLRTTQKSAVHSGSRRKAVVAAKETTSSTHAPLANTQESAQGHTTLQSMRKPELVPGAIPHQRRFLSIEHELADLGTALKVLEKRTQRAEKRLLLAWCTAALALLLAGASMAL